MPDTPVSVHVPSACTRCGAGPIRMQQQITGRTILLQWQCSACDYEWPVTRKEQVPPPLFETG
jgi:hypothetical protein